MKKNLLRIPVYVLTLFVLLSATTNSRNPFPEIERYKLKNGLEIIFADYGSLPVTNFTFYINVGRKSETPGQQGLASLTANSLTLGNEKYTRIELDRELHRMAAFISSGANQNFTSLSAQFLNTDLEKGMDMLAATLLKPSFPLQDIEEEKNFVLTQNKPAKMDIGDLAAVYGNYFVYGIEHPLGRHFYEAQYKKTGLTQIKEFYNFNYTPANTKLVVTGKPDRAQVKKLIETYFGAWTAAYGEINGSSYDLKPIKNKEYAFVNKTGATQACLIWMKKAPTSGSKDETAFLIANRIFSDRLMHVIREEKGFTYGIFSSYDEQAGEGIFRVRTQVRNEVVYETMTSFDEVLKSYCTNGATEKELQKIRTQMKNDLLGMESPAQLSAEINPWVYRDYEKRKNYLTELDAIDLLTLNKLIKKYFAENAYKLMIAGDEKVIGDQLSKITGLQKFEWNVIERDF
jgi:zinc protease